MSPCRAIEQKSIMRNNIFMLITLAGCLWSATSCNDKNDPAPTPDPGLPEEYYSGGLLGTTSNTTASCFEDFTQSVEDAGLVANFRRGERRFEVHHGTDHQTDLTYYGLGPLYNRTACIACHPGYGHGQRITEYRTEQMGNGCLIIVTDRNGNIATSLGLVPMTAALPPFKPMIDETKVNIEWRKHTDDWGNRFADGESYELIYPEISIPADAYYSPLEIDGSPLPLSEAVVTFESTIGLYGTGLLDAISDEDIRQQYINESKYVTLNPAIWNGTGFTTGGVDANGSPMRFDYACDFSKLQENVSLWEVTNIITPMFRHFYIPEAYARTASQDADVTANFYKYYPEWNKTGNPSTDVYNYLTCQELDVEMDADASYDLMVWLRGLAVPAARNVTDSDFKRGQQLFSEMGCAACHRPSWTTGNDAVVADPYGIQAGKAMPRYPNQKIWPYTDMIQHRLFMVNDIRTGWCRTTPLWGRGLNQKATGHDDRMHDCRARNVIEAIMWHGASRSDARQSVENFRQLNKSDRDAVVKFIESI